MAWHNERTGISGTSQKLGTTAACKIGQNAKSGVPKRTDYLDRVVHDIAGENPLFAFGSQAKIQMPRGMARKRFNRQTLGNFLLTVYEFNQSRLHNRKDAVGKGTPLPYGSTRTAINSIFPKIVVLF